MPRLLTPLFFILCGCTTTSITKEFPSYKVGTWCETDDGGYTCFAYTTYRKDGSVESFMHLTNYGVGIYMKGNWWHDKNQSCLESTYIYEFSLDTRRQTETELLEPFCNTVIEHTPHTFTYANKEGKLMTMYRVTPP